MLNARRFWIASGVLLVLAVILAGCSPQTTPTATPQPKLRANPPPVPLQSNRQRSDCVVYTALSGHGGLCHYQGRKCQQD